MIGKYDVSDPELAVWLAQHDDALHPDIEDHANYVGDAPRWFQRYNRWASRRLHMHFYAWEPVCDWLGVDMIPIPVPKGLGERLDNAMMNHGGGFWRFSFES